MATLFTSLVIVICFAVGGYYQFFSDKIDSPVEQLAEKILEEEGIQEDFSANKKKKMAEKNNQDSSSNVVASDSGNNSK